MRTNLSGTADMPSRRDLAWRATLAGSCASLVGIGLARFAYTPLLPAIIGAHWFVPADAAYLGAANLLGYLAGALLGRRLSAWCPAPVLLRALMLLATASFFACAQPVSLPWFFVWRLLSGMAGGALMVLAAPTVLPHVPAERRGFASGLIFAGVGIGVAASGTLVPLLLAHGLAVAWYGLGALSFALTIVAWSGWPHHAAEAPRPAGGGLEVRSRKTSASLKALYVEYALNAAGQVPHMLFLVDYVARGLGQGVGAGSHYWVLFGLGAIAGPVLSGHLADRIGFGRALRVVLLVEIVAVGLPAAAAGAPALVISTLVVGAFTPGIVPLVLGRIQELLPGDAGGQKRAWSAATAAFALLQASGAYAMSFLFGATGGSYRILFATGAVSLAAAFALDIAMAVRGGIDERRAAIPR